MAQPSGDQTLDDADETVDGDRDGDDEGGAGPEGVEVRGAVGDDEDVAEPGAGGEPFGQCGAADGRGGGDAGRGEEGWQGVGQADLAHDHQRAAAADPDQIAGQRGGGAEPDGDVDQRREEGDDADDGSHAQVAAAED